MPTGGDSLKTYKFQFADQIAIRKLSLLLELALPDANRTWRIAFANGFLNGQKFGFAMQIGAARNMKELVTIILGHGHKSGHR
jgi:hypothetical protein